MTEPSTAQAIHAETCRLVRDRMEDASEFPPERPAETTSKQ